MTLKIVVVTRCNLDYTTRCILCIQYNNIFVTLREQSVSNFKDRDLKNI